MIEMKENIDDALLIAYIDGSISNENQLLIDQLIWDGQQEIIDRIKKLESKVENGDFSGKQAINNENIDIPYSTESEEIFQKILQKTEVKGGFIQPKRRTVNMYFAPMLVAATLLGVAINLGMFFNNTVNVLDVYSSDEITTGMGSVINPFEAQPKVLEFSVSQILEKESLQQMHEKNILLKTIPHSKYTFMDCYLYELQPTDRNGDYILGISNKPLLGEGELLVLRGTLLNEKVIWWQDNDVVFVIE